MASTRLQNHFPLHLAVTVLLGAVVGVVTVFGQTYLPGNLNPVASLGTVWLCPAFFYSGIAKNKFLSAISATLCLMCAVFGYYLFQSYWSDYPFSIGYHITMWLCCSVVAGIIFGTAGYLWYHKGEKWHSLGLSVLSSVFLADGLTMIIHLQRFRPILPVALAEIIVGSLFILLCEKDEKNRMRSFSLVAPITILGLIGYEILYIFY